MTSACGKSENSRIYLGWVGLAFLLSALLLIQETGAAAHSHQTGRKILYIDSYHAGHIWSDKIAQGIEQTLEGTGTQLKTHRMEIGRSHSNALLKQAGLRAKAIIEEFAPDVVIVADDEAVRHLLRRHYRDAALPFVFCGVNWDAGAYGLPYGNTTGVVEVAPAKELIETLKQHARGTRIGYIGPKSSNSRRNIASHERTANIIFDKTYLIDDFEEWKRRYLALQDEVDLLIVGDHAGIAGWSEATAISHVRRHSRIPSGTLLQGQINLALIGYLRVPEEAGQWAAEAALKILDGTSPKDIPLNHNEHSVLKINGALRAKLGIPFSAAVINRAEVVRPYTGRKVFYVSSYKPTRVEWSRGIRDSIVKAFEETGIEFRDFFMGTKENTSEAHAETQALKVKRLIEDFQPDVVITSDDAAAKYLIAPYFSNSEIPFVFVGVNWDASQYGLPTENVTGMIEVDLANLLVRQLRRHAKGERIGILSEKSLTYQKNMVYHTEVHGIRYDKSYAVRTFEEWKDAYIRLQEEVDMMILSAPFGVKGWNPEDAKSFTEAHIKIPTGGLTVERMPFVLMGYVRLAEEQGEWAAETTLRILDGMPPNAIKPVRNVLGRLLLNRRLINKLGIVVDRPIYRLGEFVE